MSTISMIACKDEQNKIGYKNELLFNSKEDMKFFKEQTMDKIVIMGRKTYESIGKSLKGRTNVVLTKNKNYNPKDTDVLVRHSITDVKYEFQNEEEIVCIGGEQLYNDFMSHADYLYITEIHHTYKKGDTFFPEINKKKFKEFYFKEIEESGTPITFHKYKRLSD